MFPFTWFADQAAKQNKQNAAIAFFGVRNSKLLWKKKETRKNLSR